MYAENVCWKNNDAENRWNKIKFFSIVLLSLPFASEFREEPLLHSRGDFNWVSRLRGHAEIFFRLLPSSNCFIASCRLHSPTRSKTPNSFSLVVILAPAILSITCCIFLVHLQKIYYYSTFKNLKYAEQLTGISKLVARKAKNYGPCMQGVYVYLGECTRPPDAEERILCGWQATFEEF